MTFDGKAFGADIVAIVRGHVERSLAPLNARLDAFEKMIAAMPVPKDGKDADPVAVADLVREKFTNDLLDLRRSLDAIPDSPGEGEIKGMIAEAIEAAKPVPVDVKAMIEESILLKVDPQIAKMAADIQALNPQIEAIGGAIGEEIAEHVGKALASIPIPLTVDETKALIADAVSALPPAEKGKDADPVEVAAQIAQEVERAVAAIPAPKDGQSVTLDDVRPLIDEAVTKAVTLIPVPKDGADGVNGRDADPVEAARILAQKANDNYSISDGEFASRVSICLGRVVEIKSSALPQPDTRATVA